MGVLTARATFILLLLSVSAAAVDGAKELETFPFSHNSFNKNNQVSYGLVFKSEAGINNDALQVTSDTGNSQVNSLLNKSGRVLIDRPFKLYDGEFGKNSFGRRVASFNTSFLVNIYPQNNSVGEGLAFIIAPNLDLSENSAGEFLGHTNASTDGNSTNRIIAVELDMVKQEFDPDDNHLGLNINSVRSIVTVPLTEHCILLAPVNPPPAEPTPQFHNIWINYDGVEKVIRIYMAQQPGKDLPTPPMPATAFITRSLNLQQYLAHDSYFGFSASTGNTSQLNCVRRWNLTVEYFPGPASPAMAIGLGVGIPVLVTILAALAALGYYIRKKRKVLRSQSNILSRLRKFN